MNKTYIKDMNNRAVYSVQTQGSVTRLNDSNNRTVATYNSQTNTTISNGKAIGLGNQLLKGR